MAEHRTEGAADGDTVRPEGWVESTGADDPVARYGHVAGALRRHAGITDPERLRAACAAYAEERGRRRYAVMEPGEVRGLGAVLLMPDTRRYMGRADTWTAVVQGPDGQLTSLWMAIPNGESAVEGARTALGDWLRTRGGPAAPDGPDGPDRSGRGSTQRRPEVLNEMADVSLSPFSREARLSASALAEASRARVMEALPGAFNDVLPDPRAGRFRFAFMAVQMRFERTRMAGAMKRFAQHLDPEALHMMRSTAQPNQKTYNFLMADNPQARTRRRQAVRSYPLFAKALPKVAERIDAGAPPPRALAEFVASQTNRDEVDRTDRLIRRCHGLTWQRAGRAAFRDPIDFIDGLGEVPPDWQPRGRKDYAGLRVTLDAVEEVAVATHLDRDQLIRSTGGRWQAIAEKAAEQPPSGLRDMIHQASQQLAEPQWVREMQARGWPVTTRMPLAVEKQAEKAVSRAILGDKGLGKVLDVNNRYHRALTRIEAAAGDGRPDLAWLPLSAPKRYGDYTVTPLTSQAQLTVEGRAMGHCVGGYASACLNRSHVLSIRRDGERVSTVQVVETGNENKPFKIRQNYGPRNSQPPAGARQAAESYLREINDPKTRPDLTAHNARRAEVKQKMAEFELISRIGFDPEDRAASEAVAASWQEVMIGPGRKARDLDDLMARSGLAEIMRHGADSLERDRQMETVRAHNAWAVRAQQDALARTGRQLPDAEAWAAGTITYGENLALVDHGERRGGEFVLVEPGSSPLLRDMPRISKSLPASPEEAEARAAVVATSMREAATRLSERANTPEGREELYRLPDDPKNAVVIGLSTAEARAYKQTLVELEPVLTRARERGFVARARDFELDEIPF